MIYRHYKGGLYESLTKAKHTETGEELVIYKNLNTGEIWARPKKMFYGSVMTENGLVKRFSLIN